LRGWRQQGYSDDGDRKEDGYGSRAHVFRKRVYGRVHMLLQGWKV